MGTRLGQVSRLATWEELSRDSLWAAKLLADQGHLRSSVSRAYYAAYCAIAGACVARGVTFPYGWRNPSHEQLPDLVMHNLALPRETRWRLARNIRVLRDARESADYRPGVSISRAILIECLRLASWVMVALGIGDD
jgi:uncharacterized protein (UPF0332 family)